MRRLRLLLDANVLVDAQARDLFLTAASFDLIEIRWSDTILAEVRRALVRRPSITAAQADRVVDAMKRAFPDSAVLNFEPLITDITLPDHDDEHVVAAAIQDECDLVVTENVVDFPAEVLEPFELVVATIDDAIHELVATCGGAMRAVIDSILERMRRPAMSVEDYLERLSGRAPIGTLALGVALGVESYVAMLEDLRDADGIESPQSAVRDLLDLIGEGNEDEVGKRLDPALTSRLAAATPAGTVVEALATVLSDVDDRWGFATAKRPQAPDTELVKLVRTDGQLIAHRAQLVQAHLFLLRRLDDRWLVVDIDGPDPALVEEE